jgi:hypothetical protein
MGYEPFDYRGIHSDHRGLYLDLALDILIGSEHTQIQPSRTRDFSADKPDVVVKYIETKYNELIKHNIVARLQQLEQTSSPNHQLAEKIDRDMARAARIAAKAVKPRNQTPWSPKLAQTWAEIHLLKMIKSQLRNPRIQNWSAIFSWRDNHPGIVPEIPRTMHAVCSRTHAQGSIKSPQANTSRSRASPPAILGR